MVQIYDHFTIGVIQALEEAGFRKRGEGGAFVAGGRLTRMATPLSTPRAAVLQPPRMFGMLLVLEAVHQLRQEAGRRLPKARPLVHALGMVFSVNTTP